MKQLPHLRKLRCDEDGAYTPLARHLAPQAAHFFSSTVLVGGRVTETPPRSGLRAAPAGSRQRGPVAEAYTLSSPISNNVTTRRKPSFCGIRPVTMLRAGGRVTLHAPF